SAVSQFFGVPFSFLTWPGLGVVASAFFRLQGMVWLSLPLIAFKTDTGLRMPQWLGYALYPLHLLLLIALKYWVFGMSWQALLAPFVRSF
ncbi:MAG: hypothetical protein FWF86_06205, partial [Clostridia bacterium]|nr:hypothetical protein [Clostridia bacterium]